jgi:hypothetical protein
VDTTAGSVLLCFLDYYLGYHQIALHPDDEDKTAFITPHDIYYYKVMTISLKNVGATYQKVSDPEIPDVQDVNRKKN